MELRVLSACLQEFFQLFYFLGAFIHSHLLINFILFRDNLHQIRFKLASFCFDLLKLSFNIYPNYLKFLYIISFSVKLSPRSSSLLIFSSASSLRPLISFLKHFALFPVPDTGFSVDRSKFSKLFSKSLISVSLLFHLLKFPTSLLINSISSLRF